LHPTLERVRISREKNYSSARSNFGHIAFVSPPFGSLKTTYDVHLGLVGKRIVDFLSVLIELFLLGVTAESLYERK